MKLIHGALARVLIGLTALLTVTVVTVMPVRPVDAAISPPDQTGPYAVGYANTSFWCNGWHFSARLYYPATSAGQNTTLSAAGKPYPGIVVAPASFIGYDKITWITRHLASHGFVVISYNRPNILDLTTNTDTGAIGCGITKLISENTSFTSKVKGGVNTAKLGAAGVSLGGAAVLRKAPDDPRIKAVVALTPGGGAHYYGLLTTATTEWWDIAGGNHTKFTDPGGDDPSFSGGTCPVSTLSTSAQQVIARGHATAWFQEHL